MLCPHKFIDIMDLDDGSARVDSRLGFSALRSRFVVGRLSERGEGLLDGTVDDDGDQSDTVG